jgi:putative intracellular protease/amidase
VSNVLVVVAQRYNANELWPILKELKAGDHTWFVTAYDPVIVDERSRKGYRASGLLQDIESIEGFDGIVFISGNPADTEAHWTDAKCNKLVTDAQERDLPMAAICASVPALGPALEGMKVSAYPLSSVRESLLLAGAQLQKVSLYTDGNIVTAENEIMANMWARNFRCRLEGKPAEHSLQPSSFKYSTRDLDPVPEIEFLKKQRKENHDDVSSE